MIKFNKKKEELGNKINELTPDLKDGVNEKLTSISGEIQKLSKELHDGVMYLPSYSVKIRQNEIRDLEKLLKEKEDSLVPKKKFGFKSKVAQPTTNAPEIQKDPVVTKNVNNNPTSSDNYFTIEGIKTQSVTYAETELNGNDVLIKDSTDSTIVLVGSPSTLRLVNLKNCKLLCGPVHTSVFVDSVRDSVLFLCCQQLRTHSSEKVDIYLRVASRAIIEDCKDIRFGPYSWEHEKSEELHAKTNISHDLQRFDAVDDFNWLSSTHSPNWSLIPEEEPYPTFKA
jgi:hypothetical protein